MLCDYDEGVVGYVEEGEGEDGLATRVSKDNIADIVEDYILYIVQLQVLWPFVQDDNSIIVGIVASLTHFAFDACQFASKNDSPLSCSW